MALDLSRFAKAFFEEAQEHLYSLESLLIAVDIHSPDDETLNAIFRAVHSVKGGAAAFGFTALTSFTHEFESLLDRVRKRKLALTKQLVDLCLTSSDIMRRHLAVLEQDETPDLEELVVMQAALANIADSTAPPTVAVQASTDTAAPQGFTDEPIFQVAMRLMRADYADQAAIDALLADIRGLGDVSSHECEMVDSTHCELRFSLAAELDQNELRESLEFLAPADSIYINRGLMAMPAGPIDTSDDGDYGFFAPLDDEPAAESITVPHAPDNPGNAQVNDIALASLADASSIRVNVAKVDQLINLVGELVIAEAMLVQADRKSVG